MSPYQIKESYFSNSSPIQKSNLLDNNQRIDQLCVELNTILASSGNQDHEWHCSELMNNYHYLRNLCRLVCSKNNHFLTNHHHHHEPNKKEISDSSDDESSSDKEIKKKYKKEKINKTLINEELINDEENEQHIYKGKSYEDSKFKKHKIVKFSTEFDRMNHSELSSWLISNGFEFLGSNLPISISSGYNFRTMSDETWSNELGVTSDLEIKRLRLCIRKSIDMIEEKSTKLSYEWVAQWLDEIGLGQYKYEFLRRKIDGTMLSSLTFKDIRAMGIYNPIHQSSLKRSIQLLRQQQFHPCYLKSHANTNQRRNVVFWTVSDVASWLKSIKMSRKIKYIRNQGINGALMILEPRFHSSTLLQAMKVRSKKHKKKVKEEYEKLIPYPVLQDKEATFLSNSYMPFFKNPKEEKKYSEMWSSLEAESLLLCPINAVIEDKFNVPQALQNCPVHQQMVKRTNTKTNNATSYI